MNPYFCILITSLCVSLFEQNCNLSKLSRNGEVHSAIRELRKVHKLTLLVHSLCYCSRF